MAKILSLEIKVDDLDLKPEAGVIPTPQEIMKRIIVVAVRNYGEQCRGLLKAERKQSQWLYTELEKAAATELKSIEVPDDVFGFLRKVFREVRLPPMDKILDRVEAQIDAVSMGS